ncbi:hypothetical protein MNV49_002919 [Pseudohyphozyma bogoriensis]|nr:hypothetical protein MNV49_002919 [Pseudohyphozyma bogoriensis]
MTKIWSELEAAAEKYNLQGQLLVGVAIADTWAVYGGSASATDDAAAVGAAAHYISDCIADTGSLYDALREYNGPVGSGGSATYQTDVQSYMEGKGY